MKSTIANKLNSMKQILVFFSLALSLVSCASCSKNVPSKSNNNNTTIAANKMKIKVGNSIFAGTLYDNATATAFKALLPLTVNMVELNSNEKYVDLPRSLPANASNPGTIQNGDLMLYGSSTLVLFYKTFSTSYSYTKLGRINDTSELTAALGSGDLTLTFAFH